MDFVKIGESYYNIKLIGWILEKEVEGTSRYFAQFIGGRQTELTAEEYEEIRTSGGGGGGDVSPAQNGVQGTIEGTYDLESLSDTIVDIRDGKILNIFIKDIDGFVNIRDVMMRNKAHTENQSNPHNVTASQTGAYTTAEVDAIIAELTARFTSIENLIPGTATSSNKLTDENFVNTAVNNLTAYYITKDAAGNPFSTYAEFSSTSIFYSGGAVRVPTQNDYAFVQYDENHSEIISEYTSFTTTTEYVGYYVLLNRASIAVTNANKDSLGIVPGTTVAYFEIPSTRYICNANGTWSFQFIVNNTGFNANQMAAINSGLTVSDKNKIDGIESGAEVNDIDTIKQSDGTALTITNKSVTLPEYALKSYVDNLVGDINAVLEDLL